MSITSVHFIFLSGERGIWTLAPVLPTYSLSRGAPSASLGISPCRYLQSKFLNNIIFIVWFQEESHWFSELRSGEDGIRTHVPVRTNGFQDRRVMTTSLPLQNGGAAPFSLVRICASCANKWYFSRRFMFCQCCFLFSDSYFLRLFFTVFPLLFWCIFLKLDPI